ncbi:hypothetical protein BOTBODRAFT_185628 [Botryobasidium botryosum FD-172 SS1]|uniref:DNA mismatch repair proteins mutS family domain-containing protein n=1 Tax=Botryobasidium botryosum (strain FD-172 SS1) TaxID=930990 RepID=A0A067MRW4_BOTB1|nr:hypothetical protein BOTBODRAFT_185628 [Botryobasidium botryosum FD-172 SS1]
MSTQPDHVPTCTGSESENDTSCAASIAAVVCQSGRVGGAYFDPEESTLYLLEDTQESSHYDLTIMFLEQTHPDLFLTSSNTDETLIRICRDFISNIGGAFQLRPHREFNAERGREALFSLDFLDHATILPASNLRAHESDITQEHLSLPAPGRQQAAIRIGNFSRPEAILCMSAISVLLDQLARDHEGGTIIQSIKTLALEKVMHINAGALSYLQVFEDENHASVHSKKTKEGLSLCGILDHTQTTLGNNLLRTWLVRPLVCISALGSRHDAVACLLRDDNSATADTIRIHLKGINHIPQTLALLKKGRARLVNWTQLVKFSYHTVMLQEALQCLSGVQDVAIIRQLLETFDASTPKEMGAAINEIIDWQESESEARLCVRQHVDVELDEWRRVYQGLDSLLSKVALKIRDEISSTIAPTINVLYIPQLGYLICVTTDDILPLQEVNGWVYQFSSEDRAYFKSSEMHDLDHHIGDLHTAIAGNEVEIAHRLQQQILGFADILMTLCESIAELDCLLSFAVASKLYGFQRPHMTDEDIINIKNGRHPLIQQCVDTFVPNDAYIARSVAITELTHSTPHAIRTSSQCGSITICTGANACGKSVYLKQIALIVYMAQVGCFVPADSATIGPVDKIFALLQTQESVSKPPSAFMSDLNQVSYILRNCTSRSLVLLDEFGKGTIPSDGAALLCGLLRYLHRHPSYPKVIATTHFHDIFQERILSPTLFNYLHLQVILPDAPGKELLPGTAVTYLYRVVPGLSVESHAAKCAVLYGLPSRIVKRAQYASALLSQQDICQILAEDTPEHEKQQLRDAEDVCRRFLAWDIRHDHAQGIMHQLNAVLGR